MCRAEPTGPRKPKGFLDGGGDGRMSLDVVGKQDLLARLVDDLVVDVRHVHAKDNRDVEVILDDSPDDVC